MPSNARRARPSARSRMRRSRPATLLSSASRKTRRCGRSSAARTRFAPISKTGPTRARRCAIVLRSWRTTFAAGSRTFRRAMRRHAGIAISTRSAAFSRSMTARAPREPPVNDIAALALRDDAARADALDITRSWLVQAPAGSGKTSLLIQRYLALLAAVERPEHIVAMTFTRKAAAEMRARIVQALSDAGAPAGDAEIPAHEALTRRLAQAALEHERQMGWRLLEQ